MLIVNDYEMIGTEGSTLEKVTLDGWKKEGVTQLNQLNLPTKGFLNRVDETIDNDAVLKLLKVDKEAPVVGIEMYPLNTIHAMMELENRPDDGERYYNVMALRNEVGLARLILLGKKRGVQKCAMVIGATHGAHLAIVAKKWGIQGQFYRALSEADKAKPHHQLINWIAR
jgi:hypothetical protein